MAANGAPASNGLIPSDLYSEIPKFVDKKTLLEYMKHADHNHSVAEDMRQAYQNKLRPYEDHCKFGSLHSEPIDDAYFGAKPMILLIGQYSSGKSTFVKYLIDMDYPGIRIGPEPTTDKFVAVMHSEESAIIPGNALVLDKSKPFRPLVKFGGKFLNRFQASLVNSPVLKGITIIDSPGILTDNCKDDAYYDYKGVIEYFAARADRIFLFVDAHKLELSGDFQQIVQMIRAHDDKLRIVLNKTDMISEQELIRIYGALMWFLGQTLELKEVIQIYIGSFWGQPVKNEVNRKLYEFEQFRIFEDLANLPKESLLRKANYLVKRAREVSIHACIVALLREKYRSRMLRFIAERRTKRQLVKRMPKFFTKIESQYNFNRADFPELPKLKETLLSANWHGFKKHSHHLAAQKEAFVNVDIPLIVTKISAERSPEVFKLVESPFGYEKGEGFDEGSLDPTQTWVVDRYRKQYEVLFCELKDDSGKVSAAKAKAQLLQSNLPAKVLTKVWGLSDIDRDGALDLEEFMLALYLVATKLNNPQEVPNELPKHLIPPTKRALMAKKAEEEEKEKVAQKEKEKKKK